MVLAGIVFIVREFINTEEAGGFESNYLPAKMREIAGTEGDRIEAKNAEEAAATDPELPPYDQAYADPELLRQFGVDGVVFKKNARTTYRRTGTGKRKRKKLSGVYAQLQVLDDTGSYRVLASVECLDAPEVAVELEDQGRDLAGRLGVPFQTI